MKKTTILISTLAFTGLLLSTGCNGGDFGSKMFSKFDANSDGFVDKKEYLSASTSRFEKIDDNGDEKITLKESKDNRLAKRMPEVAKSIFAKYDSDKNGEVTKAEMKQTSQKEFIAIDTNKDSKLTQDEMKIYRKIQIFEKIDANNDNMISKEEFQNSKSPFQR